MVQEKVFWKKAIWGVLCGVFLVVCIGAIPDVRAQDPNAEASYQQFLEIYRAPDPTRSELEAALGFVKAANRQAPNTYKYVFSLGAINSTLSRWEQAIDWLVEAKSLATTAEAVRAIEVELNYCRVQLARIKVAEWGPEPVKISFVMKKGTVEMSADTIARLPQTLPVTSLQVSAEPIKDALAQRLGISDAQIGSHNGFLIVSLSDEETPTTHFQKGIKDFHRFFTAQYFSIEPENWVTVVIAERPLPLVNATRRLYPSVGLPQYAPFLGYYNPSDNLIMATSGRAGYGTLLHEMVHALMKADFPDAPAWLNEGLASLYERSQWRGHKLYGLPNWRMDGMREAHVSTLSQLSEEASGVGMHGREIAEYRLLLLFMDQRDLLGDLYRMVKQGGPNFSLKQAIQQMDLTEADWRQFLKETFAAYQAELAQDKGALSHPDEIRFVQQALKQTVNPGLAVDGHWGKLTDEALMEFQRRYGLVADGILGPKTAAELKRQYERARVLSVTKFRGQHP